MHGVQGTPPIPSSPTTRSRALLRILLAITDTPLDSGTDHFQPSDRIHHHRRRRNPAANVTPARAEARFNIRFNDLHTGESVLGWLRERCRSVDGDCDLEVHVSGEPFLSPPGPLSALVSAAVEEALGRRPELGTTGGTSDARFIKDHCPVAEFGLVGKTMHQVDERVDVADISRLADIYEAVWRGSSPPEVEVPTAEIARALYGAYRLARFDAGGCLFQRHAGRVLAVVLRALFVAPLYLLVRATEYEAGLTVAPPLRLVLVSAVTYAIAWLAFPWPW